MTSTRPEATIQTRQYDVQIRVTPRPGILDPEGETIGRALAALGYEGASNVRAGRLITLRLEAQDAEAARTSATELCERLIANPIIEDFSVQVDESPAENSSGEDPRVAGAR